jgi:hypothetical protein
MMKNQSYRFFVSFFNTEKSVLGIDITRGTCKMDNEEKYYVDITFGLLFFFVMLSIYKNRGEN